MTLCEACDHEIRLEQGTWYHYEYAQGPSVSCYHKLTKDSAACGCKRARPRK